MLSKKHSGSIRSSSKVTKSNNDISDTRTLNEPLNQRLKKTTSRGEDGGVQITQVPDNTRYLESLNRQMLDLLNSKVVVDEQIGLLNQKQNEKETCKSDSTLNDDTSGDSDMDGSNYVNGEGGKVTNEIGKYDNDIDLERSKISNTPLFSTLKAKSLVSENAGKVFYHKRLNGDEKSMSNKNAINYNDVNLSSKEIITYYDVILSRYCWVKSLLEQGLMLGELDDEKLWIFERKCILENLDVTMHAGEMFKKYGVEMFKAYNWMK